MKLELTLKLTLSSLDILSKAALWEGMACKMALAVAFRETSRWNSKRTEFRGNSVNGGGRWSYIV